MEKELRHYVRAAFAAVLLTASGVADHHALAQRTVRGIVTSQEDGSTLAGVNIVLKGTQTGTSTDASGSYSLQVPGSGSTLVFSFIGYESQEVPVGNRSVVNLALAESPENLQEVVVTALGLSRDKRSLGYAVAEVDGKDLSRVAQENVLNSLAGRVPGVTINTTGGAGSSVSMIIRGATSLSNDNQPLFVVDGVPIANTLNNISQVGRDNRVDYGNAISDLNPNDIESVSILKGPSAAALYGSRAGNGVVLITTKSGAGTNKMTVNVTSNTVFDRPFKFLDMHSRFATGILPFTPDNNPYPGGVLFIDEGSAGGIGPELDKGYKAIQWNSPIGDDGRPVPTELVSHPDNVRNFVQTGITTTNGISIANSSERLSYRLSYSNMQNRGIIPNSDLFKNNLGLTSNLKLSEKLSLSTNVNVSRNNSNNRPAGNRGSNPMQWAYAVSPHIDIRDLRDYWLPGQEGIQQRSQAPGEYNNPYFLAYEVNNGFVRDRVFGNVKADWQITPEFSFMARFALDTYNEQRESKVGASYTLDPRGAYGIIDLKQFERNTDVLATYAKDLGEFNVSVSGGGNIRYNTFSNVSAGTRSRTGLVIPGLFTLDNIAQSDLEYGSFKSQRAIYSVYGLANFGFKDMIYLDLTARNDWSSTLPAENRSYFYPSASLSILLNEMLPSSNTLSLLKLRGGIAQAGNDANPYSLLNTLQVLEPWGNVTRLGKPGNILLPDLKPEIATSYEFGLDAALFRNRLRFEATYYQIENRNQIIPTLLPSSTGFSNKNINAGLLVSKGVELALGGTPIDKNGWRLDINTNLTRNRTRIVELSDELPFYTLWRDAKGGAWTYVGDEIGDIYDAELVTVKDPDSPYFGWPILDDEGSWQDIRSTNTRYKIGNFNPDFILGGQVSLSYKAFSLNMSFDWRKGGDFVSQTYRYGESDMRTQRFLDNLINPNGLSGDALANYLKENADELIKVTQNGRYNIVGGPTEEYGGFPFKYGGNTYPYNVFNPGVIAQYNAEGEIIGYTENLGGPGTKYIPYGANYPWSFTRAATFDADFVKLREISLAYDLPSAFTQKLRMQNASVAVYSRNVILWTKAKIGVDPEMAFQQEAGAQAGTQFKQGIERYNVIPWVLPVGVRLNLTF